MRHYVVLASFVSMPNIGMFSEALVTTENRRVQWDLMKANFGKRWEGLTQWYTMQPIDADVPWLEPRGDPLRSIYQLEFPEDEPDIGTWRGWGVMKPGDTRVVPLSESSVLERTLGATTFQFPERVGGRCGLRADESSLGIEVNFFHGERRSGLVLAYTSTGGEAAGAGSSGAVGGGGGIANDKRLTGVMLMAFREAPILARLGPGRFAFVDTPSATLKEPLVDPLPDLCSTKAVSSVDPGGGGGGGGTGAAALRRLSADLRDASLTRCTRLGVPGHELETSEGGENEAAESLVDWLLTGDEDERDGGAASAMVTVALPEDLWVRSPRVVKPNERAVVAVGCGSRAAGMFRSLVLEFSRDGALVSCVCVTYRWREAYRPYSRKVSLPENRRC